MHAADTLEQACADAWPAVVEDKLGSWRLRAAGSFTGRANSALTVGDPGMPTSDALHAVCEFAHANGIEPMAQAVYGDDTESALAEAGWRPYVEYGNGHEVSVLTGPLEPLERLPPL